MADSPTNDSGAPRPENYSKWFRSSEDTLQQSRSAVSSMLTALRKNEIQEAGQPDAATDNIIREKREKKDRVYNQASQHQAVINTAYSCTQEVEKYLTLTEDSKVQLHGERYQGFAAMQINDTRLELRDRRPPAEHFKDILTDALTSEKSLLDAQRQELMSVEEEGKKVTAELTAMRVKLSRCTGERRICIMNDIHSLKPVLSLPPGTELPTSPKFVPEVKQVEESSKVVITKAVDLLDRATKLRNKSIETVERCKKDREKARIRTEECINRRCQQLTDRKRELEKNLGDVQGAITKAERGLHASRNKCPANDTKKKEKLDADQLILEKLLGLRATLQEDIKNKFLALEIDNMCKRVNASKASEWALKKEAALQKSSSAPTLKKKDPKSSTVSTSMGGSLTSMNLNLTGDSFNNNGERPPSAPSPGGSRSLKAGAAAGLAA
eukprot:TRINITY_DN25423_c0_g1_i1.p1 TRINITY_DN25423_c0_g1~~TRINITY_DN25423_c0_g1_i1.p1  ORF type:complete len:441 (+),score=87.02 TRINITY_DN25423_c0_g1_i1:84-1406(+)